MKTPLRLFFELEMVSIFVFCWIFQYRCRNLLLSFRDRPVCTLSLQRDCCHLPPDSHGIHDLLLASQNEWYTSFSFSVFYPVFPHLFQSYLFLVEDCTAIYRQTCIAGRKLDSFVQTFLLGLNKRQQIQIFYEE